MTLKPAKRLPDFSGAARDFPIRLGPAAQVFRIRVPFLALPVD